MGGSAPRSGRRRRSAQPSASTAAALHTAHDADRVAVVEDGRISEIGGKVREVGTTVINDAANRSVLQVDVVALAAGQRRQARSPTVRALGAAKSSDRPRTLGDLARLERARALLVARGVDATDATLLLFGRSGFAADLGAAATGRDDVVLVDLDRLWAGD